MGKATQAGTLFATIPNEAIPVIASPGPDSWVVPGRIKILGLVMRGIVRCTLPLVWGAVTASLAMAPAFSQSKKISRGEPQIVLNVENIKPNKIKYRYFGWNAPNMTAKRLKRGSNYFKNKLSSLGNNPPE